MPSCSRRKTGLYEERRVVTILYVKEGSPVRISLPIHGNRPLKLGLLKHLMKIAEIDEGEL